MSRPHLTARGRLVLEVAILVSWIVAVAATAYAFGGADIFNP